MMRTAFRTVFSHFPRAGEILLALALAGLVSASMWTLRNARAEPQRAAGAPLAVLSAAAPSLDGGKPVSAGPSAITNAFATVH